MPEPSPASTFVAAGVSGEPAAAPGTVRQHSSALQWWRTHLLLADSILAAALIAVGLVWSVLFHDPAALPLIAVAQAPVLVVRRTHPVVCLGICTALCLIQAITAARLGPLNLAPLIALYSSTRYARGNHDRRIRIGGLVVGLIGALIGGLRYGGALDTSLTSAAVLGVTVIAAWLLGELGRSREQLLNSLQDRARAAELTQQQETALAVAAERARIAREMHDVVAHSLALMTVQADGGRYAATAGHDPDAAGRTLETISEVGRRTLDEMRSILGALRNAESAAPSDPPTVRVPTPELSAVPELLDRMRTAGLDLRFVELGTPRTIPPQLGVTAYRIVQESLTNVLKHAGQRACGNVTIEYADSHLAVTVYNDGPAGAPTATPRGHGLTGMRERATIAGGRLTAGPLADGWLVRAELPYLDGSGVAE